MERFIYWQLLSLELVRSVETGRRPLTGEVFMALRPLVQHLPAPEDAPAPEAALPPGTPGPDASELDFRRHVCQHQAIRCGNEMAVIEQQARVARHWVQALPALRQAAAEIPPDPDNPDRGAWLTGWLTRHAPSAAGGIRDALAPATGAAGRPHGRGGGPDRGSRNAGCVRAGGHPGPPRTPAPALQKSPFGHTAKRAFEF